MNLVLNPSKGKLLEHHRSAIHKTWGGKRTPSGGRPQWTPSPTQAEAVKMAAAQGLNQQMIAALIGVSESTLKRRCKAELRDGALLANAQVALVGFQMATSGMHPNMTQFFLRTRLGWK